MMVSRNACRTTTAYLPCKSWDSIPVMRRLLFASFLLKGLDVSQRVRREEWEILMSLNLKDEGAQTNHSRALATKSQQLETSILYMKLSNLARVGAVV